MALHIISHSPTHFKILPSEDEQGLHDYKRLFFAMKLKVPGHQYMPRYKFGDWDGTMEFLGYRNGLVKLGLLENVLFLIKQAGIELKSLDKAIFDNYFTGFDREEVISWLEKQKVYAKGMQLYPRDYQLGSVIKALTSKRILIKSPTSSGKSLIIYLILKFLKEQLAGKILIIVPTTNLVNQLYTDFCDYANTDKLDWIELSTQRKKGMLGLKKVLISTWQTLIRQNEPEFWNRFECLIVDEAHHAKAASLSKISDNMRGAEWRFGFSGSIREDWKDPYYWSIVSQFGSVHSTTTTKKLIEQGQIAQAKAVIIEIDHTSQQIPKLEYRDELAYLCSHEKRNALVERLCGNVEGNTLILFSLVKLQGKPLYEKLKVTYPNKKVLLVYGAIDAGTREEIRRTAEDNNDVIIVASYQTYSTGVNIKNLHNIVFASPTKSFIRIVQSIGRGLRKADNKNLCVIYDFFDLLYGDPNKNLRKTNYTYRHFLNRLQIYKQEGFPITMLKEKL